MILESSDLNLFICGHKIWSNGLDILIRDHVLLIQINTISPQRLWELWEHIKYDIPQHIKSWAQGTQFEAMIRYQDTSDKILSHDLDTLIPAHVLLIKKNK